MTLGAAVSLGGAHQRLLPEAVPLRFFGMAAVAHALAWLAIAIVADAVPFYQGGPGPVAAAFHLLTVGVLLSTAMGASLQMLPVALGRTAPAVKSCNLLFSLLFVGVIGLVSGFAIHSVPLIAVGAATLFASVATYGSALIGILKGASGLGLVRLHVWAALLCLGLGVLLALLLAIDYGAAILPDHQAAAVVHMLLAVYGFMGLLAFGLSQILIPMFAIAEPQGGRTPAFAFALALAALALAAVALLASRASVAAVAAVLGLGAAGCHIVQMEKILAKRIRRRLGGEFILIRLAWTMLPLSLLLAFALALGLLPPTGPALFGFVAVFGWLLTIVVGIQQRILPFLGSMHAVRAQARPLAPAKLVNAPALRLHRWCHGAALVVVALGIGLAEPIAIRLGACAGLVGALAYAAFAVTVLQRTRHHLRAVATPTRRTLP